MRSITILAAFLVGAILSAPAQARSTLNGPSGDVAVTYEWLHSNTQPGQCGCFNFNGTGISSSWTFTPRLAAVLEGDVYFATGGPGTGSNMTLASGSSGMRAGVLPARFHSARLPGFFAEALAGLGHAGGGIAGAGDGSYGFVGRVGGGFDRPIGDGLILRVNADYLPTTFSNGGNNHQNNTLIGAGLAYRWSRGR